MSTMSNERQSLPVRRRPISSNMNNDAALKDLQRRHIPNSYEVDVIDADTPLLPDGADGQKDYSLPN